MQQTEQYGYIDIDKTLIPYRFDITLAGEVFHFDVRYAETTGIITVDLYDADEEVIVYGEPLIYGHVLFSDVVDERLPLNQLVPLDPSGNETTVTFSNIGDTVFLFDISEPLDNEESGETL